MQSTEQDRLHSKKTLSDLVYDSWIMDVGGDAMDDCRIWTFEKGVKHGLGEEEWRILIKVWIIAGTIW